MWRSPLTLGRIGVEGSDADEGFLSTRGGALTELGQLGDEVALAVLAAMPGMLSMQSRRSAHGLGKRRSGRDGVVDASISSLRASMMRWTLCAMSFSRRGGRDCVFWRVHHELAAAQRKGIERASLRSAGRWAGPAPARREGQHAGVDGSVLASRPMLWRMTDLRGIDACKGTSSPARAAMAGSS